MPGSVRQLLMAVATVALLTGPAAAQDLTTSDIQRLQQLVDEATTDLGQLRQRDRGMYRTLSNELSELEDEVIYLKVKLRKERRVARAEYTDLRNRLENLRSRARGDDTYTGSSGRNNEPGSQTPNTAAPGTLPTGTELDVRLQTALSSDTAQVEDRFEATTMVDVRQDGRVLVPAGSTVRGVVTEVKEAGRIDRKGSLNLSFDQITINGRSYPMRGTLMQALESGGVREDAEKIGAGAAVGGIIGGILGGLKGALAGILIGGGGVVAATEGQDVELPAGTVLRLRLDQPLALRPSTTRR